MNELDTLCVEITTRCPLACVHCSASSSPTQAQFLPVDVLRDCLADTEGLSEIYLSGGEPFEHPELFKLAALARSAAPRVVVYSSGTSLCGDKVGPLSMPSIGGAVAAGIHRIDVSLYSMAPAQHDEVTQTRGSYDATILTLRRLRMLGIPFGIHYVPIADRGLNFLSVLSASRNLGASRFHALSLVRQGRARSLSLAEPLSAFYDDVREVAAHDVDAPRVVFSSRIRDQAGLHASTSRDLQRVAMLSAAGFFYLSEGKRSRRFRTTRSLLEGARAPDLLRELASM